MFTTALQDIQRIIYQSQQPREWITELDLSSVKIFRFNDRMRKLIQGCRNLAILKLSECELGSLERLPGVGLVGLDVSGNKLKDSDLQTLPILYPNLSMLNLSDNLIQNISSLQHLKKLTKLKDLQLSGNQISHHDSYREQAFRQIKGLELLDKLDRDGQPLPYDSYSDQEEEEDDSDEQQQEDGEGEYSQQVEEELDEESERQMGANQQKKRKYQQEQESQSDS